MSDLSGRSCVPCRPGQSPLDADEAGALLAEVPGWTLESPPARLVRRFPFKGFLDGMAFAAAVAREAEAQDHHPRLTVEWKQVTVEWWTHAVAGLHRNDFIMAARTQALYASGPAA